MAESVVSFLLNKLSALQQEKRQLLVGLEREVEWIHDELGQLRGFLRDADAKEETDSNLKEWITQLRDISFDLEDVLDKYMLRAGGQAHRGTSGFSGCIKRLYVAVKDLRARDQVAREIQAIKYRLESVTKNKEKYREMYGVISQGSTSGTGDNEWYDGRGEALLLEDDEVVGIEEPRQQLLTRIESIDNGLDVIAVVGMGGLGKTTLVKKVFDDETVKMRFSKHAWIAASDFKDVKPFLKSLIEKLFKETKELAPQDLESMDVDEMRNFVHENLKETKYIVVVDDIWDVSRWESIRFAFPRRGGSHGCVIITTRFSSIADAACSQGGHVCDMKPLSPENSNALFYKKAFPSHVYPPYLREYAENILNKCDGLPLAIVVIGGLLATKKNRAEEWERFSRSLVDESEGSGLRRLWKLLSLSYNDLPYNLKYCFLYLSMLPEWFLLHFTKDDFVRLWIAEGFVESKRHQTMEEVARDYLNQLSSRNLLQVVKDDTGGGALRFRIHDLLQEYLIEKSREQNMVTIYDGREIQWPNKIRRLVILKSVNFSPQMNKLKYLRSLLLLSGQQHVELESIKQLLSECKLLKVLYLGTTSLNTIPDEVFRLYHLKYLCLSGTNVSLISKEIKYLENLETLDMEWCNVTELPDEILNLHKLRHLLVYNVKRPYGVTFDQIVSAKAPCNIGACLPHLQTLCCIDADEVGDVKMVRELGKLTQLRRLDIAKVRSEDGRELCASLAKLTYLSELKIVSAEEGEKMDLDYSLSSTGLPFLVTLELSGCIEKVPQWIPSLNALTSLSMVWSKLNEDPLRSLQHMPNLECLWIHDAYVDGLRFKAGGFQKLEKLFLAEFKCLEWIVVEKGSMPTLERWEISDCKLLEGVPKGIEDLTKLQHLLFGNMSSKFVDRFVEEQRNEGDDWRLAHVPFVHFGIVEDGYWIFDQ